MANIYDQITDLYTKGGYFTRYAGDFWLTIILCLIVFIVVSYYHVQNNIQPILDDWSNQRCNPAVIPFAGMINAPTGESALQFTGENFEQCTQTILGEIAQYAFMPIYYLLNAITEMFNELSSAMDSLRSMFNNMRNSISDQGNDLFSRGLNITLPIVHIFRKLGAILGKTQGTLVSGMYTLYAGYITTNSLFMFIYEVTISILYIILAFILLCFGIGWLFPPMLASGLAAAAFMALLLIPTIIIIVIMQDIFSAAGLNAPPAVPGYCFSGEMPVKMESGRTKKISDIVIGDITADSGIVTAVMKSSSHDCHLFNIDGIVATANHKVYYDGKWISTSDHPRSFYVDDFNDTYVYCIGTTSKTIKIKNMIFADWDEVDDVDINELRLLPELELPNTFTRENMHEYLDSGMHPDTIIYLDDGRGVPISDIEVNDVLLFGEKVTSVIKIKADDLHTFHRISCNGEELVRCSKNTEVLINSLGEESKLQYEEIEKPKYMNHLVTDKGGFKLNGLLIGEYSRGVDRHLSEEAMNGILKK
tara:strand:+ start:644 stop:2245 length:1602 start_codon:yes stop_codon:yes gene_type:complete